MAIVRNMMKIVFCVGLAGCHAGPVDPTRPKLPLPDTASVANPATGATGVARRVVPAVQTVQAVPVQASVKRPPAPERATSQVVHVKLASADFRERAGKPVPRPAPPAAAPVARPVFVQVASPPVPQTPETSVVITVPYPPESPPLATPLVIEVPTEADRLPALQRELAQQLALRITDLRAKVQVLSAAAKARATPPAETQQEKAKKTIRELKAGILKIEERLQALDVTRQGPRLGAKVPDPVAVPTEITSPIIVQLTGTQPLPVDPVLRTTMLLKDPHDDKDIVQAKPQASRLSPSDPRAPGPVASPPGGRGEEPANAAPTASQQEINRLITQCLSELEKEVRDLGERMRPGAPPK